MSHPHIVPIDTPTLGDRSYVIHDGSMAAVIDPQRDIDRVLAITDEVGARITHVFETHVHNDYVTGGLALARATGAEYHVNADDDVSFSRTPIRDGDLVELSPGLELRALATPGHTFTHLSYVLVHDGEEVAVFSGGSLLYGATGRPDLLGHAHTDELVRHQHRSARRLAELPDSAELFPTHGFGSFCSATQTESTASTIGDERRSNPALTQDEETYVRDLLAGLDAWPAYYAQIAPANLDGPTAAELDKPRAADAVELRRRIDAGEWVVDLRTREAFAAGFVPGTLNFGLDGSFVTYLGWLIPWGAPLTVLGETADDVAEAQRELVRIGVDRLEAAGTGSAEDWSDRPLATYRRARFAELAQVRHHRPVEVLDVRRDLERAESAIEGTSHVPLHELLGRLDDVPDGEVWVHCAGGYRASIAASVLAAQGRTVLAIDDDFSNAESAGLPLVGRRG